MCSWLLPWVKEEKRPEGQWAGLSLTAVTCGLIGPVPTVVLPITLLALRDALPIATLEGLSWTTWKAQSTQRGLETPAESAAGNPGSAPKALTALQLITVIPTVVHAVTDPEEGLAEFVLACKLVGGVAF